MSDPCLLVPVQREWSYENSVATVKPMVSQWKDVTEELLQELWTAREMLTSERLRDATGTFVPMDKTWHSYCQDVGLGKRTVNRWLFKMMQKKGAKAIPAQCVSETCVVSDLFSLIKQSKKFRTIYADPPWHYDNQGTRASTDKHYQTMASEDIKKLPIPELSMERAHLHLWTTNAFLSDALDIIATWGFEYKGVFVWVKPEMGIGNYWRVSHELMLLGVKGNMTFLEHTEMSWHKCSRGKHSAKPEEIRAKIEKVSVPPRLELFGRKRVPGWVVWGDEIERDLFFQDAEIANG